MREFVNVMRVRHRKLCVTWVNIVLFLSFVTSPLARHVSIESIVLCDFRAL